MEDETYRIPGTNGRFPIMGHLTACRKCGRKVLGGTGADRNPAPRRGHSDLRRVPGAVGTNAKGTS